ncbi:MAG TPA: DNA primase [Longimicrobiales bacterium]|nr:DNA primase [Longimicrobiales bacterium]
MIPDHLIDEVRDRADIVEMIGELIPLKRAGKDFRALCPFHNEKTPSFYVVPSKGFYKCFGCGESGDVFSFLMKQQGLSFTDAVRQVAERVGVEIPRWEGPRQEDEPHRRLYEAISFAADFFERMLREPAGEHALRYLQKREVSDEAITRFRIGYAPDDWQALRTAAHQHGIEDEVLLDAGLIKESERGGEPYDRFRNRLMFSVADVGGRVIAFGGRVLTSGDQPKYLNSPETPIFHKGMLLYGLNWSRNAIRREGAALVVEGYMDYVALASRNVEHVVAGMGTAMTPEQANLLARYAGRALLLYDSDTAGGRATFRTADALLRAGVHPLVVALPAGEDPDSLVRKGGAAALRPYLDEAVDVLERKLQMLEERHYFDDIDGARRALDRLLPTIRATVDPALRDIYIGRVAQRIGVTRETLEEELRAGGGRDAPAGAPVEPRSRARQRVEPVAEELRRQDSDERLFVVLLVHDPERVPAARELIAPADLRDPVYRTIYSALLEGRTDGLEPAALERLASLEKDGSDIVDADRSFEDAVASIHRRGLFLQLDGINLRMARITEADDADVLLTERMRLLAQLRALPAELGHKRSPRYGRLRPHGPAEPTAPDVED